MNSANKIIVLLAAAVLIGCSAEEKAPDRQTPRQTPRQAITFGATATTPTRTAPGTMTLEGEGTGETSLRSAGFGVFACHTGLHPYVGSDVTSNYMWNQSVTYDATDAIWDYTPQVYWPNPVEGLYPYVSFFAYAPYAANPGTGATAADQCIVDMSRSVESGDPWIVYQLGGSEDDWQDHQVDLLYDFRPDQQQGDVPERIDFQFRHALASAGDRVVVTCSSALQWQLKGAYTSESVSITIERVTLVYTLLRKGRLRLNSTTTPLWELVASETPTVQRRLVLKPESGYVLCTATSATNCVVTDYTATNQGIFYIPLASASGTQRVDIAVDFHTSLNPATTKSLAATIDLTAVAEASSNRSIRIVMPELESL